MKRAFSLLELSLVIIILSLILGLGKVYIKNDKSLQQAAKQILNDLIYARNLALMQGSFRLHSTSVATKNEWFKSRWQIYFIRSKSATNNEQTYTIFLDKNGDGNANIGKSNVNLDREIAVDILNAKKLMNSGQSGVIAKDDARASARFNIEQYYGVNKVEFKGACSSTTRIIFDEFGRLHSPLRSANKPYEKLIFHKNEPCIIKLMNANNQSVCIVVEALSGYAYIPRFENSDVQLVNFKGTRQECRNL